jgi:hypothetical protein
MSDALRILLENIEQLSTQEKALAAHCLLSSMDSGVEDVDKDWLSLAESRSAALESGAVQAISWDEMKKDITS